MRTNSANAVRRTIGTGPDAWERARSRLALLERVGHPAVAVPVAVESEPDGRVVAVSPAVDGLDVAAAVRATRPLTAGECVWLGQAILGALAALHAAGVAHGDISPRNVILARRGPVLVDVMGGDGERGTPGFAAPERAVRADPACDVYSVGKLLAAVVDDDGATRVGAWVAPMVAADPLARPDAATAARALASCARAEPLRPIHLDIAGQVRARAIAPSESPTEKDPAARPWRVRTFLTRGATGVAVAVGGSALLLTGVVGWLGSGPSQRDVGAAGAHSERRRARCVIDGVGRSLAARGARRGA